jgi:simple sugar transport system permease protein
MTGRPGELPPWAEYGLLPLLNVALAFLVSGVIVVILGENPVEAMRLLAYGAFGYPEAVGYTLYYATNFIFTGLAVAVAFHAGLFNIGGEGQAYVGGLGLTLAALASGACRASSRSRSRSWRRPCSARCGASSRAGSRRSAAATS